MFMCLLSVGVWCMYVCRYAVCMYVYTCIYPPLDTRLLPPKMRPNACFGSRKHSGVKTNVLSVFCVTLTEILDDFIS